MALKIVGEHSVLGNSFGGTVIQVPCDHLDDFYRKNKDNFSPHGQRSFFQAMGVPPGFAMKQADGLQTDMLTAQKIHARKKSSHMLLLAPGEEKIGYVAPKGALGWEDPSKVMGLTEEAGWRMLRDDYSRGLFRYVAGDLELGVYKPAVMLMVPIFYTRALPFQVGLFNLKCLNGAIDSKNCSAVTMEMKHFNKDVFNLVFNAMREGLKGVSSGYASMMSMMKSRAATLKDGFTIYSDLMNTGNIVPKTLLNYCIRHFDTLEKGKEVEELSPSEIKSEYDIFDTMTFYSKRLPSVTGQTKAESAIFSFFHGRCVDRGLKMKVHGVDDAARKVMQEALPKVELN